MQSEICYAERRWVVIIQRTSPSINPLALALDITLALTLDITLARVLFDPRPNYNRSPDPNPNPHPDPTPNPNPRATDRRISSGAFPGHKTSLNWAIVAFHTLNVQFTCGLHDCIRECPN